MELAPRPKPALSLLPLTDPRGSAASARAFTGQVLTDSGWPVRRVEDARTVVSELVVSAMAAGRRPSAVTVDTRPDGAHARIEVVAAGRAPSVDLADRRQAVALITALSSEHGSRPDGDGRTWWAVLDR